MIVERDIGNKYDRWALTVKLPNGDMLEKYQQTCAESFQVY